ncbi:hypothetical protein Q7P35_002090 [Cladosporium inversicolor]
MATQRNFVVPIDDPNNYTFCTFESTQTLRKASKMMASNMTKGTTPSRSRSRGAHHHRRQTQRFPPQTYSDLTRTDLSLIAPILLPQTVHESRSAYEKKVKKSIADLPQHLHCKIPLLSSFCNLHSKFSPGPITSLFNSLREEIEDEVPKTWGPLMARQQLSSQKAEMVEIVQHLAVLWLGPKVFQARFEREPRRTFMKEKPSKCCACTLVAMAGDFQTQVAMAGLFIGRINQNMWEGSKRIMWYVEWTIARLPKSRREDAKGLIWEIGKKFRMTRLGAEGRSNHKKPNLEAEEESELGPGTASYVVSLDRELREERSKGPRKLIGGETRDDDKHKSLARRNHATEQDDVDLAIQLSLEEQEQNNQADDERYAGPYASSFYSQGDTERALSISIARDIDGIIAMYDEGALNPNRRIDDDDQYNEPSQRTDDTQSQYSTQYGMAPSRVQSMLDRSFGSKWDGPKLGGGR